MDLVRVSDTNSSLMFKASKELVIRRQAGLLKHIAPRDIHQTAVQHAFYGFTNNIADTVNVVTKVDQNEISKTVSYVPRRHLEEELKTQLYTTVVDGKVTKIWSFEDSRQISFVTSNRDVVTLGTKDVFCQHVLRAAVGNVGARQQDVLQELPMVGAQLDPTRQLPAQINMRRFRDEPTADELGTGFVRRQTVEEEPLEEGPVAFNSQDTVPIDQLTR